MPFFMACTCEYYNFFPNIYTRKRHSEPKKTNIDIKRDDISTKLIRLFKLAAKLPRRSCKKNNDLLTSTPAV